MHYKLSAREKFHFSMALKVLVAIQQRSVTEVELEIEQDLMLKEI